jgi:hypothetical protein
MFKPVQGTASRHPWRRQEWVRIGSVIGGETVGTHGKRRELSASSLLVARPSQSVVKTPSGATRSCVRIPLLSPSSSAFAASSRLRAGAGPPQHGVGPHAAECRRRLDGLRVRTLAGGVFPASRGPAGPRLATHMCRDSHLTRGASTRGIRRTRCWCPAETKRASTSRKRFDRELGIHQLPRRNARDRTRAAVGHGLIARSPSQQLAND